MDNVCVLYFAQRVFFSVTKTTSALSNHNSSKAKVIFPHSSSTAPIKTEVGSDSTNDTPQKKIDTSLVHSEVFHCYRLLGNRWSLDKGRNEPGCFRSDSCYGGQGLSKGVCYKWVKSPEDEPTAWRYRVGDNDRLIDLSVTKN